MSLTKINHHVTAPTSTDCTVQASTGTLHFEEDMLLPLAVITGLEFQGVDHANVAAAELDADYVEVQLSVVNYVQLV